MGVMAAGSGRASSTAAVAEGPVEQLAAARVCSPHHSSVSCAMVMAAPLAAAVPPVVMSQHLTPATSLPPACAAAA